MLHVRSYCLADRSQHDDDIVARQIAKTLKWFEVQLESQMFDGADQ